MAVEGTDGLGPLRGGRILAARTAGLFSRIHLQTKVVIFKCFFEKSLSMKFAKILKGRWILLFSGMIAFWVP